jgi:hypothetical protein
MQNSDAMQKNKKCMRCQWHRIFNFLNFCFEFENIWQRRLGGAMGSRVSDTVEWSNDWNRLFWWHSVKL